MHLLVKVAGAVHLFSIASLSRGWLEALERGVFESCLFGEGGGVALFCSCFIG